MDKNQYLKKKLDNHYHFFDKSQISPDPLEFPHRFEKPEDIEISAFVSSVFAYGSITQIMNTLEKIHRVMNNSPYRFISTFRKHKGAESVKNIAHRFYTGHDVLNLFSGLSSIYDEHGSIKRLFLSGYSEDAPLKSAISKFAKNMIAECGGTKPTAGIKFMFPDPEKGSACKRMNLFLRWMVRKDELDFGLWNEIPVSKLIIPVDTHVARICRELRLTGLKNVSWKMGEEITENLRMFDPRDPVKYDFAICHIGMRKLEF